jgi:ubiquinone/menaquinone biosynthesis C-methylase UbiE
MGIDIVSHKKLMDDLYSHPKFQDAVEPWAAFFAKNKEEIFYSNWRYLNEKRQRAENNIWKKLIYPGAKVLDIGCGKGFFLKRLHDNFGSSIKYYAVDLSSVVISQARNYSSHPRYFVGLAEKLPFKDKSFEYIQIISTLEHVTNPGLAIKEAYRVLKDKGYLYIVIRKKSLDSLIIYNVHQKIKKLLSRNIVHQYTPYSFPISWVRTEIFRSIKEGNLRMIERNDLAPNINVIFYRKLHLPMSLLLRISDIADKLKLSIFKDLEYRVYQK